MPRLTLVNPQNPKTLYGSYPWQPLSLAYIAGATPEHWDVRIVDELVSPLTDEDLSADVVGITAFTTQVVRAYEIAARAKALGAHTVLGGVHASFMPDEAARYVDTVFTGEGEHAWPGLLADFERGVIKGRYEGGRTAIDDLSIRPRRDLLVPGAYAYASVQTTRGCPLNCSFCSVTAFNGRTFRTTQDDWTLREFRGIDQDRILLVDDDFNGFSKKARDRALRLCNRLADEGPAKQWITQMTINFGEEDELPRAAARAGCAAVFIGFESIEPNDLANVAKKRNRGEAWYADAVKRIHDAGIAVVGSFILGIDGQDVPRTVDATLEFIEKTGIDAFNPTLLTPLPGTRDRVRYLEEGRVLPDNYPDDWVHYNLGTPTVRPSGGLSPTRLYREYLRWMEFFEPDAMRARARRTQEQLGRGPAEAAWLWNLSWSRTYHQGGDLPQQLEVI